MNDVPTKESKVPQYRFLFDYRGYATERLTGHRTAVVVDIQELFRDDLVGLEKYQERLRGIERRLDKVIRRNK